MNCKECKSGSDGVPDCVIDGTCPYELRIIELERKLQNHIDRWSCHELGNR